MVNNTDIKKQCQRALKTDTKTNKTTERLHKVKPVNRSFQNGGLSHI